jgi:hypothetical protein
MWQYDRFVKPTATHHYIPPPHRKADDKVNLCEAAIRKA